MAKQVVNPTSAQVAEFKKKLLELREAFTADRAVEVQLAVIRIIGDLASLNDVIGALGSLQVPPFFSEKLMVDVFSSRA
jgi:hypothetical protein